VCFSGNETTEICLQLCYFEKEKSGKDFKMDIFAKNFINRIEKSYLNAYQLGAENGNSGTVRNRRLLVPKTQIPSYFRNFRKSSEKAGIQRPICEAV
jgi:hypothetical protein